MTHTEIHKFACDMIHGNAAEKRLADETYNNRRYTAAQLWQMADLAAGDIQHYTENADDFIKPGYLYHGLTAADFSETIKAIWEETWRRRILAHWRYRDNQRGHKSDLASVAWFFRSALNWIQDGFDYKTEVNTK